MVNNIIEEFDKSIKNLLSEKYFDNIFKSLDSSDDVIRLIRHPFYLLDQFLLKVNTDDDKNLLKATFINYLVTFYPVYSENRSRMNGFNFFIEVANKMIKDIFYSILDYLSNHIRIHYHDSDNDNESGFTVTVYNYDEDKDKVIAVFELLYDLGEDFSFFSCGEYGDEMLNKLDDLMSGELFSYN